jgi:hypothetical protein
MAGINRRGRGPTFWTLGGVRMLWGKNLALPL